MRRIIWFNFFLINIASLSYGQIIIKDTIDIEGKRTGLADEEPPVEVYKYSISTTIFGGAIKTNHANITLISDQQTFIIKECPVGDCYPPSSDFTVNVLSNSPAIFITYTDGQQAPSVKVDSYKDPNYFSSYKIWFTYSPDTWGKIDAGRVKVTKTLAQMPSAVFQHYFQKNDLWKDIKIDHSSTATIGGVGCALSSMAMILKAYGIDADPKQLNDYLKSFSKGFVGIGVSWSGLNNYNGNNVVQLLDQSLSSLKGVRDDSGKITRYDPSNSTPYNLQIMDSYLALGYPIIVQVANLRNDGTYSGHYVLVTSKTSGSGGGAYTIYDPGSTVNPILTLSAYDGKIYQYIVYGPK